MYHSQFCAKLTRIQNSKCVKVMALEEWRVTDRKTMSLPSPMGTLKLQSKSSGWQTRREDLLQLEI